MTAPVSELFQCSSLHQYISNLLVGIENDSDIREIVQSVLTSIVLHVSQKRFYTLSVIKR